MKDPLLLLLAAVVIALVIAGFVFLSTATTEHAFTPQEARTPALVSGITCLTIGTGLLVLGVFMFRKRD